MPGPSIPQLIDQNCNRDLAHLMWKPNVVEGGTYTLKVGSPYQVVDNDGKNPVRVKTKDATKLKHGDPPLKCTAVDPFSLECNATEGGVIEFKAEMSLTVGDEYTVTVHGDNMHLLTADGIQVNAAVKTREEAQFSEGSYSCLVSHDKTESNPKWLCTHDVDGTARAEELDIGNTVFNYCEGPAYAGRSDATAPNALRGCAQDRDGLHGRSCGAGEEACGGRPRLEAGTQFAALCVTWQVFALAYLMRYTQLPCQGWSRKIPPHVVAAYKAGAGRYGVEEGEQYLERQLNWAKAWDSANRVEREQDVGTHDATDQAPGQLWQLMWGPTAQITFGALSVVAHVYKYRNDVRTFTSLPECTRPWGGGKVPCKQVATQGALVSVIVSFLFAWTVVLKSCRLPFVRDAPVHTALPNGWRSGLAAIYGCLGTVEHALVFVGVLAWLVTLGIVVDSRQTPELALTQVGRSIYPSVPPTFPCCAVGPDGCPERGPPDAGGKCDCSPPGVSATARRPPALCRSRAPSLSKKPSVHVPVSFVYNGGWTFTEETEGTAAPRHPAPCVRSDAGLVTVPTAGSVVSTVLMMLAETNVEGADSTLVVSIARSAGARWQVVVGEKKEEGPLGDLIKRHLNDQEKDMDAVDAAVLRSVISHRAPFVVYLRRNAEKFTFDLSKLRVGYSLTDVRHILTLKSKTFTTLATLDDATVGDGTNISTEFVLAGTESTPCDGKVGWSRESVRRHVASTAGNSHDPYVKLAVHAKASGDNKSIIWLPDVVVRAETELVDGVPSGLTLVPNPDGTCPPPVNPPPVNTEERSHLIPGDVVVVSSADTDDPAVALFELQRAAQAPALSYEISSKTDQFKRALRRRALHNDRVGRLDSIHDVLTKRNDRPTEWEHLVRSGGAVADGAVSWTAKSTKLRLPPCKASHFEFEGRCVPASALPSSPFSRSANLSGRLRDWPVGRGDAVQFDIEDAVKDTFRTTTRNGTDGTESFAKRSASLAVTDPVGRVLIKGLAAAATVAATMSMVYGKAAPSAAHGPLYRKRMYNQECLAAGVVPARRESVCNCLFARWLPAPPRPAISDVHRPGDDSRNVISFDVATLCYELKRKGEELEEVGGSQPNKTNILTCGRSIPPQAKTKVIGIRFPRHACLSDRFRDATDTETSPTKIVHREMKESSKWEDAAFKPDSKPDPTPSHTDDKRARYSRRGLFAPKKVPKSRSSALDDFSEYCYDYAEVVDADVGNVLKCRAFYGDDGKGEDIELVPSDRFGHYTGKVTADSGERVTVYVRLQDGETCFTHVLHMNEQGLPYVTAKDDGKRQYAPLASDDWDGDLIECPHAPLDRFGPGRPEMGAQLICPHWLITPQHLVQHANCFDPGSFWWRLLDTLRQNDLASKLLLLVQLLVVLPSDIMDITTEPDIARLGLPSCT